MNACLKFPEFHLESHREPVDRATLSLLRFAAKACRASARIDPERACSIIDATPLMAVRVLVSALPGAFGGPIRFYGMHETELSFDERWLLSAINALRRGDLDSLNFLVSRRVPPQRRRWLIVLIRRVTDTIDETAPTMNLNMETENGATRI